MHLPQNLLAVASLSVFFSLLSLPARAATIFGTDGIKFDEDTIVDFTFNGSNNAYTSSLKIFQNGTPLQDVFTVFPENKPSDDGENGEANAWRGTCGNTVLICTNSFTLQGGVEYTLGLESTFFGGSPALPVVYSTSSLNTSSGGSQQAIFGTFPPVAPDGTVLDIDATQFQSANPFAGSVRIAFDDRGSGNDADFNDFRVTAQARPVPEPASMGGLAVAIGALTLRNRRKIGKGV